MARSLLRNASLPWSESERPIADLEGGTQIAPGSPWFGQGGGRGGPDPLSPAGYELCSEARNKMTSSSEQVARRRKGADEVQAAMEEASLREMPRIEKRTGYQAMIGNVATLVGLHGTIVGLIQCFAGVAGVDASEKARVLSDGIAEAMNCTAFGLIVAIPSLVAFSLLQGRTQHMIDDINETSVGVLNLIVANKDKMRIPTNLPQQ